MSFEISCHLRVYVILVILVIIVVIVTKVIMALMIKIVIKDRCVLKKWLRCCCCIVIGHYGYKSSPLVTFAQIVFSSHIFNTLKLN